MVSSLLLTAQPDLTNISMANAGIVALLGYGVVFFGLILLMLVITLIGAVFVAKSKKQKAQALVAPAVQENEHCSRRKFNPVVLYASKFNAELLALGTHL